MKSHLGLAASKSLGIPNGSAARYSKVAHEYYDASRHPTCADFRFACELYLANLFSSERPAGRIADIGCGKSLLQRFVLQNLVLIDESQEMLALNDARIEKRLLNVVDNIIGTVEFDWIFAVLGDPYNVPSAWKNIAQALKPSGECVFIVPSWDWTSSFRRATATERSDFARFDLSDGTTEFLPSYIYPEQRQFALIAEAGLTRCRKEKICKHDLDSIRSPKIADYLDDDDAVLDIYRASK